MIISLYFILLGFLIIGLGSLRELKKSFQSGGS
jgi:hypothetical protein